MLGHGLTEWYRMDVDMDMLSGHGRAARTWFGSIDMGMDMDMQHGYGRAA
jgi:hypothetical protein